MNNQIQTVKQIKETFELYRGLLLDACEQEVGHLEGWSFLRSRLLKLLSDQRGLEAKVNEIVKNGGVAGHENRQS